MNHNIKPSTAWAVACNGELILDYICSSEEEAIYRVSGRLPWEKFEKRGFSVVKVRITPVDSDWTYVFDGAIEPATKPTLKHGYKKLRKLGKNNKLAKGV